LKRREGEKKAGDKRRAERNGCLSDLIVVTAEYHGSISILDMHQPDTIKCGVHDDILFLLIKTNQHES
jgi:hypothetical protein